MTTQPVEAPEVLTTTPNNATAYPTDHLYVKSPAETEAAVLAAVEDARVSYQSSEDETERLFRHRAGVPDPNPPLEPPAAPAAVEPPPAPAPPPDAADESETPVEVEVKVTPKKPSSTKK
jgi:hypothetical protein